MEQNKKKRDAGVYVILYKNQDGQLAAIERGTKRETVRTLEGIGAGNIVKVYRGAKLLEVKVKLDL